MMGVNASTGARLNGVEHLRQSIGDILSTPIGTRVARRDYGSLLPEMLDQPFNETGRLRLFAAVAIALARWERRLKLNRVSITRADRPGAFTLDLEGTRTDGAAGNSLTRLTIPLRSSGGMLAFS